MMWRERLRRIKSVIAGLSVAARLVLSAIAAAAILIILYDYVFNTTSIDAVISAEIIEITAPIAGHIDFLPSAGQILPAHQIFAVMHNDRPDDRLLQELSALRQRDEAVLQSVDQELTTLTGLGARFTQRAGVSHDAERQRLESLIRQAEVTLPGAKAQLDLNQAEQQRVGEMVDQGEYHPVRLLDAKKNAEHAAAEVNRLEALVGQTQGQLAALDKGAVIGEGFDDAPYSEQRLDELTVRIADLTNNRNQVKADLDDAERRFNAEQIRLEKTTKALLSTEFAARLWDRKTDSGIELKESAAIVDLADCDHLFVEATLPERLFDRIKPGNPVRIRPYGADHDLQGIVRVVRGNGAPTSLTSAVNLERSTKKIMIVDIDFTAKSITKLKDCPIGRSATATFE